MDNFSLLEEGGEGGVTTLFWIQIHVALCCLVYCIGKKQVTKIKKGGADSSSLYIYN